MALTGLIDSMSSHFQEYIFSTLQYTYSFSTVIRASVPKLNLDDAFEQKNEIARAVEDELEKAMSAYGYEIVQTLIVDIEPDEHVKRAMNEINAGTDLSHTNMCFKTKDLQKHNITECDNRQHSLKITLELIPNKICFHPFSCKVQDGCK